ncbi:MAG: histidine kinase dimerization/phospho-acceptor domain-containing protein [Planctomycetota bacterium]
MSEDDSTQPSTRDEVRALRARVEQLKRELAECRRPAERSAAAFAHKLNNPLGMILLRADHALRTVDDDAVRDLLEHIKDDVKHCTRIIRDHRASTSEDTPVQP